MTKACSPHFPLESKTLGSIVQYTLGVNLKLLVKVEVHLEEMQ